MLSTNTSFYFSSYAQWYSAITTRCHIKVTPEYAQARISALLDLSDPHTREFKNMYGEDYLHQVVQWFETAKAQG